MEFHTAWARSVVTGLGRVEGQPVGVLANQPKYLGGVLDADAIEKATKLCDICSGFGLPIVFLQDLPGVMVGLEAERRKVAPKLIELYTTLARSPVPKVSIVVRKAFGFGYIAMGGAPLGVDYVAAWPNAEIGFMSAVNAVHVVHHKRLRDAKDPAALAAELKVEMHSAFAPWLARVAVVHPRRHPPR